MKVLVFVALIALAASLRTVGDPDMIREITQSTDLWTAGTTKFTGMSVYEIQRFYLGTMLNGNPNTERVTHEAILELMTVPDSFDARTQWPKCIHPVRNQAQCGSCWAFGASEALSDRFCIGSSSKVNVVLSPQDLVSCDPNDFGCEGGYLEKAWEYMSGTGIVTDECYPYTAGGGTQGKCKSKCKKSKQTFTKYKANTAKAFDTPKAIQAEILLNGPIETGFDVYEDFMSYTGGIYEHKTGGLLGGHAVKIVGWGK